MLGYTQLENLLPGQSPVPAESTSFVTVQQSSASDLIAHGTGGQANATLISAIISQFGTVAADNDSARLPAATPGVVLFVINADSHSMNVFPASGEQVNAMAPDAAFAVAAGKLGIFTCAKSGQWAALAA